MNTLPAWLHGLFAVLPTPMVEDGGLDLESLDGVVEHYLAGGAVGLVPASIAGEGDLLDEGERRRVIERVVRRAAGRAPVVVGVLADRLADALTQARVAADSGADGLLVKPPLGEGQDVLTHVSAIAQSLRLPIILLDNPKFGASLPLALVQRLLDIVPEVCGIKLEDEPTAGKMAQVRALLGDRIRIFGGSIAWKSSSAARMDSLRVPRIRSTSSRSCPAGAAATGSRQRPPTRCSSPPRCRSASTPRR